MSNTVRIWDLPTRLFHWLLLISVIGSFVSVNIGGNAMAWHFRFGYCALALILFRIVWGFMGSRYARFSSFPPNPTAALAYLKAGHSKTAGHNPLGALSVYALLLAMLFQGVSGLFANDAIMWDGPLKNLVSNATSDLLSKLHHLNEKVIFFLVALHIVAIIYYKKKKKESLVKPMLLGYKESRAVPPLTEAAVDTVGTKVKAAIVMATIAAFVYWLVTTFK